MALRTTAPKGDVVKLKNLLSVAAVGAVALAGVFAAAIVFGTSEPHAPMRSVTDVARAVDRTGMPAVSTFRARDGTFLAYRAYPAPASTQVALLFHGSSDSSQGMHAVAEALQAGGVSAYSVDVRGHGDSGPRGDIAYIGQLEDDVIDLVAHLRSVYAKARFTVVGHSSGGGFVLRLAGTPSTRPLFDSFVVTAPYLGHRAVTSRGADGGGWAQPFTPRIVALTTLHRTGIDVLGGLPVIAFSLPSDAPGTKTYSYRLYRNYGPHEDFVDDVRRGAHPIALIAGTVDEIFHADRYEDAFAAVRPLVQVQLINGLGHMAIVSDPRALAAISAAVLTTAR